MLDDEEEEEEEEEDAELWWLSGCDVCGFDAGAGALVGGAHASSSDPLAVKIDTKSVLGRGRLGADLFQCQC